MQEKRGKSEKQTTGDLVWGIWLTLVVLFVLGIVLHALAH